MQAEAVNSSRIQKDGKRFRKPLESIVRRIYPGGFR